MTFLEELQKARIDEIARKYGLATLSELEQLQKKTNDLIAFLKTRNIYNPKDLYKDIVRYRLSKESSRILNEIEKGKS